MVDGCRLVASTRLVGKLGASNVGAVHPESGCVFLLSSHGGMKGPSLQFCWLETYCW